MKFRNLKNGALLVEDVEYKSQRLKVYLSNWQQGITWETDDLFTPLDYITKIPVTLDLIKMSEAGLFWISAIPAEVLKCIERFEQDFKSYALNALGIISQVQSGYDLFFSNPKLFGTLLVCARNCGWTKSKIVDLTKRKQRDILIVCGFPPGTTALKIIQKYDFSSFSNKKLENLIEVLGFENSVKLNHLSYIDDQLVRFILDHPIIIQNGYVSGRLFRNNYRKSCHEILKVIKEGWLDGCQENTYLQQCSNRRGLDDLKGYVSRLESKYINDLGWSMATRHLEKSFQYHDPPIPGNPNIYPITNSRSLYYEARNQHNCVFNYHESIIKREVYIYSVIYPERGTVCVETSGSSAVRVMEVGLKYNRMPSAKTLAYVNTWLQSNRSNRSIEEEECNLT